MDDKEYLMYQFKKMVNTLGRVPTQEEYADRVGGMYYVMQNYGNYFSLVKEAGYEPIKGRGLNIYNVYDMDDNGKLVISGNKKELANFFDVKEGTILEYGRPGVSKKLKHRYYIAKD